MHDLSYYLYWIACSACICSLHIASYMGIYNYYNSYSQVTNSSLLCWQLIWYRRITQLSYDHTCCINYIATYIYNKIQFVVIYYRYSYSCMQPYYYCIAILWHNHYVRRFRQLYVHTHTHTHIHMHTHTHTHNYAHTHTHTTHHTHTHTHTHAHQG